MTTITFGTDGESETRTDVADALCVSTNLRFSTMDGEPNKIPGGEIIKARSMEPLTVIVKNHATGNNETFKEIRFAKYDKENSMVFLSGPTGIERIVGEIVRVRRLRLQ